MCVGCDGTTREQRSPNDQFTLNHTFDRTDLEFLQKHPIQQNDQAQGLLYGAESLLAGRPAHRSSA